MSLEQWFLIGVPREGVRGGMSLVIKFQWTLSQFLHIGARWPVKFWYNEIRVPREKKGWKSNHWLKGMTLVERWSWKMPTNDWVIKYKIGYQLPWFLKNVQYSCTNYKRLRWLNSNVNLDSGNHQTFGSWELNTFL